MPDRRSFQFPKMRTFLRRILILVLFVVGDPTPYSLIAGSILIFLGQVLHFISAGTLVKTEVLTIAGPYRWVRNPFYLSNVFTDAGFCVIAWNPWVPIAWFIGFYGFVLHPRTKSEEAELLGIHGKAYQDYLDKVPRYIPSLFPKYPHVRGAFSFEALHHNREIPRNLRHFAFAILFVAKELMIRSQGGDPWSLRGFPALIQHGLGAVCFWTGVAMVLAPWLWRLMKKIFFPKKNEAAAAVAAPAPQAERTAP
ncbi:MAG: protein-S-isoprenylcysteine methyltransferase-like [Planctomycetota bacterium]|nr:MAG: protein-S-isoprenylcysteine methyltransferase-like [Planctomycetota bacterium]